MMLRDFFTQPDTTGYPVNYAESLHRNERWWGGRNGRPIPAELQPLADKYIKKARNGLHYINYTVSNKQHVNALKPYWTTQRVQLT